MKVAISGDLKGSRTIHSFVYALARFGATIDPMPAPGMELPAHVDRRLREEFHCRMISKAPGQATAARSTRSMSPPTSRTSFRSMPNRKIDYGLILQKKIDAVYVTRFQKERWAEKERPYPKIDAKFLGQPKYSEASVMHPLPRVNELDASLDSDRRAIYFQQAAYGVPVRMALISLLLQLHKNKSLHKFAGGFAKAEHRRLRAADRHRHPMRQRELHHLRSGRAAIRRQQILSRRGASSAGAPGCAASIARPTSRTEAAAHFVVGDMTRKTYSPGLERRSRARRPRSSSTSSFTAAKPKRWPQAFRTRDSGKKVRTG